MSNELPTFTIRELLEAGVHFGHRSMRRNPKMSRYVFGDRNGVSIIDLNKSANLLHRSLLTVKEIAKNNGRILFVATKKQAADVVAEAAQKCGQYYVNFRWLGGMLTNWKTVSQSIKTLKKIEEQLSDTEVGYNKKEKLVLERKRTKLEQALGGIKNMGGYPDLIFVIDTHKEAIAIAEAKKLGLPIMAILDSNCDPEGIKFPIPGNDDSAKSIKLYCRLISDAILAGIKENMAIAGVDLDKVKKSEDKKDLTSKIKSKLQTSDKKPKKEESEEGEVESSKSETSEAKPAAAKEGQKRSKKVVVKVEEKKDESDKRHAKKPQAKTSKK